MAGIQYHLHETPAALTALTAVAERQQRIWIDTGIMHLTQNNL